MKLTDEQLDQINYLVIKHFKKEQDSNNPVVKIDDECNINIKIIANSYTISPYLLHKFSIDLYSMGFQIYLGWEFIFVHFYEPNTIEIDFKILETI